MTTLILKGGTVLIHDEDDTVTPTLADILVEGDRISKIGPSIDAPPDSEIIDCTDKIISPGFIDTHHHMWESFMKGLFADSNLVDYMGIVFMAGCHITPEELWWSNLAGSLESIDAGTTTTLDHAHMNWTKHHSKQAIAGTISSGIRSIFAYTPSMCVTQTNPVQFTQNPLEDWVMETFEELAQTSPLNDSNSRVRLGFGFDLYFLPQEVIKGIFGKVRSLGVDIITSHYIRPRGDKSDSLPLLLKEYGILDDRIVLSHAGGATPDDAKLLSEANAYVSVTPTSEQSMAVGPSVAFRDDLPGMNRVCSFGIDIHSATSASIVQEMRTALYHARGIDSAAHLKKNMLPSKIYHTNLEAYNMGTIQGARALCMDKDIGSIAVGKKADLVVFDAMSPSMMAGAQADPVRAIVSHSSPGDIDTVLVDGKVRKRDGKLLPVGTTQWHEDKSTFINIDKTVDWREISSHVLETQKRFIAKLAEVDLNEVSAIAAGMLQLELGTVPFCI